MTIPAILQGAVLKTSIFVLSLLVCLGCSKNTFEVMPAVATAQENEPLERRRVQVPRSPSPSPSPTPAAQPSAPSAPQAAQTAPADEPTTPRVPPSAPAEFKPSTSPTPQGPAMTAPNLPQMPSPNLVPNQTAAEESELDIAPNTDFDKRPAAKEFFASGKPKFSYSERLKKRFANVLNKAKPLASMDRKEQDKWTKVFAEIQKVANVNAGVERRLLFVDKKDALEWSKRFENDRVSPSEGAHTVAVEATAPRHGFGNRPCAEFMSEIIRQAYKRAEISLKEDFNTQDGNELIWSETASVEGLRGALLKAGWTMWDTTEYKPLVGAVMMHQVGDTPGHTYMSGSENGMIVIDNGSPRGRDLRKSTQKIIRFMYHGGLFLLPPGITPTKWSSQ